MRRRLARALLPIVISALITHPVRAESPAWLSLIRPHKGYFAVTTGVNYDQEEICYPELWSRIDSRYSSRHLGLRTYHRLPTAPGEQALVISATLEQTEQTNALHSWSPDRPASSVSTDTQLRQQLRLGWQYENLSPLWRRGLELGYTLQLPAEDQSHWDASAWIARAIEPAVLSLAMTHRFLQPTVATIGAEVALNRRLALGTQILWQWPPDSRRVGLELGATLQQMDDSGWQVTVQLGPTASGFHVERSLPLR